MRLERHHRYWLLVGGPVPPGMAAITIGSVVSIQRRSVGNERLLRHELVHVAQWRRLGAVGFLLRYVGAYVRARLAGRSHLEAYRGIPLEVDAVRLSEVGPAGLVVPPAG